MTTLTTEDRTAQVTGAEKVKSGKRARVARKRAHVALNQAKSNTKARTSKKPPKGGGKAGSARDGSTLGGSTAVSKASKGPLWITPDSG